MASRAGAMTSAGQASLTHAAETGLVPASNKSNVKAPAANRIADTAGEQTESFGVGVICQPRYLLSPSSTNSQASGTCGNETSQPCTATAASSELAFLDARAVRTHHPGRPSPAFA